MSGLERRTPSRQRRVHSNAGGNISWLSSLLGGSGQKDPYNTPYQGQINSSLGNLNQTSQNAGSGLQGLISGGQNNLNTYAQSAMSSAMPQLNASLQQTAENSQRRGIGNGGLSSSYQGDVYGAFQKNIANAVGQQSMNLYGQQLGAEGNLYNSSTNNYLSLLGGANNQAVAGNKWQNTQNQGIGSALGGIAGSIFGGPAGGAIGSSLGGLF
jgi:hypothetical protein